MIELDVIHAHVVSHLDESDELLELLMGAKIFVKELDHEFVKNKFHKKMK